MTLRVAIVGMGGIGNNHGRCYTRHPGAEVVAVCDILQERSDKAAETFGCQGFYSVETLLNSGIQFDAASVTTAGEENGGDHYAPTMQLLRAGIPVLGEKTHLQQHRRSGRDGGAGAGDEPALRHQS